MPRIDNIARGAAHDEHYANAEFGSRALQTTRPMLGFIRDFQRETLAFSSRVSLVRLSFSGNSLSNRSENAIATDGFRSLGQYTHTEIRLDFERMYQNGSKPGNPKKPRVSEAARRNPSIWKLVGFPSPEEVSDSGRTPSWGGHVGIIVCAGRQGRLTPQLLMAVDERSRDLACMHSPYS
ncbi:hypothetical protein BKA93DRAFT_879592 [Sparassis latifolia]